MRPSSSSARWKWTALLLYLGCTLWALRVILPAPATLLPHIGGLSGYWDALVQGDQYFSVAKVTHDARMLVREPWRLMEGRHCWPLPRATTLGEHMIGEGLVGVVPDLVFHEPILTYNVVLLLLPVIAGLTMYAFVLGFTGSAPAALVAGLLFAIHPARLGNAAEPYWMGNHWTPLALLFAYRLFTRRRWGDALGLAVFTSLQLLDSFYPIMAFALIGGTYMVALLVHERRAIAPLASKLLVVGAIVFAVSWFVFVPYLRTRATWDTLLAGRAGQLYTARDLVLGGGLYPGTVMTVLAVVGIADGLRRARHTGDYDPRIPLLVGALLVLWAVLDEVPVPLVHWRVPSLLRLLNGVVPGVDAVRMGVTVSSGWFLTCAVLAGFGMRAILDAVPRVGHVAVAVVVIAALVETFTPDLAAASFGRAIAFEGRVSRPTDDVLSLYAHASEGAVLDVPADVYIPAEYVFLSAYHGHPTVACYGSYKSPLTPDIVELAKRLPIDRNAEIDLRALGIGAVVSHGLHVGTPAGHHFAAGGPGERTTLYNLQGSGEVDATLRPLAAGAENPVPRVAVAGATSVVVPFRNGSPLAYRHPDPIAPTTLRARWYDAGGQPVAEYLTRGLLPLALAPGEITMRQLTVPVPPSAGDYRLVVSSVAAPDEALSMIKVHASPPPPP